jgi:signal transduction histidine kinase/ActR/RegA family two-component response regulator/HAMP domain-containing protein
MFKSRLYWKVLAYFGLLLLLITVMTVLSGNALRNIERNFSSASDNTRFLADVERIQYILNDLPNAATQYAQTGDLNARLAYERLLRDAKLHMTDLMETSDDPVTLSLLTDSFNHIELWEEKTGREQMDAGNLLMEEDGSLRPASGADDAYLAYARTVLRELHRDRLEAHQRDIEQAALRSQSITRLIIFVNVIVALCAVALGFILTRSIVNPLRKLRESTERLTDGTFEPLMIKRNDEIGELTKNFNKMSVLLYAQYRKMKLYSELVTQLNASSSINNVAERSISHLCTYAGANTGALYLITREGDQLELIKSYGSNTNGSASYRFPIDDGVPGESVRRRLQSDRHITEDETLKIPGLGEISNAYVRSLPIIFRDRVIGVIVLVSDEPFTQEQGEILQQAVPQIAIATTNARHYEETQNLSLEIAQKNKELQRKKNEVEKAYRVKSDFLAGMSHELRTPLNAIIGYSTAMLRKDAEPITKEQKTGLEKIQRSGKHLLQLINNILELSKLENNGQTLSIGEENVESVLNQSMSAVEPQLVRKKLKLKKDIEDNLPVLRTDIVKVRQILVNLLWNAVKFTEKGFITLRVYGNRNQIHFEVKDTGIGIAPEHLEVIFDEFKQIDPGTVRNYQGTGLGLPIARRLSALLGGAITVWSKRGKGSTFTLSIPPVITGTNGNRNAAREDREDTNPGPETGQAIRDDNHQPFALPLGAIEVMSKPADMKRMLSLIESSCASDSRHVLIVDDNREFAQVLRDIIEHDGYPTRIAHNGEEALESVRVERPALIFLDLLMPGMNGFEFVRQLKETDRFRDIPVIILSGKVLTDSEEHYLQTHITEYFHKESISYETILNSIQRLVTTHDLEKVDHA